MRKEFAFTLAEVLITLGIIGVVAAMTIPTLMTNIKSTQYLAQFKKSLSTLSQAAKMSNANYDLNFGGINSRCQDDGKDDPNSRLSICAMLNGTLTGAKYLGDVRDYYTYSQMGFQDAGAAIDVLSIATGSYKAYQLADGSIFMFLDGNTGTAKGACTLSPAEKSHQMSTSGGSISGCRGLIDVNGLSKPNKLVKCTTGPNKIKELADYQSCTIEKKDVSDIFPVYFYNDSVVPSTSAADAAFMLGK